MYDLESALKRSQTLEKALDEIRKWLDEKEQILAEKDPLVVDKDGLHDQLAKYSVCAALEFFLLEDLEIISRSQSVAYT